MTACASPAATAAQAYGAIVARDATTQLLVPGPLGSSFRFLDQPADDCVGRYRYDLDAHTSVGAIATYRSGEDYTNAVGGVDARWQKDEHTLRGQWLRSDSEYPGDLGLARHRAGGRRVVPQLQFRQPQLALQRVSTGTSTTASAPTSASSPRSATTSN